MIDPALFKELAPVVVVVALFLAFLWRFGSKALDAALSVSVALESLSEMIRHESKEAKEQTALLRELRDVHSNPDSMFSTHGMREQIDGVSEKVNFANSKLDTLLSRKQS